MKSKVLFLLVLVLVFSLGVIQAADQVTLRVVTMFSGADPVSDIYEGALAQFLKDNPGIKIVDESATFDESVKVRIENDFAAGNEPDITMYFTDTQCKPVVESGRVMALDGLLSADPEWADGFQSAVLEQIRYSDGHVYAIPITGWYEGLILNVDLFEKYGLDYPTSREKFYRAIETFKENGVVPIAAGLGSTPHYMIEHSILKVGGVEAHDAGIAAGINPLWVEGMNHLKELYEMGAFQRDTLTADWSGARQLFKQGMAAMLVEGSWAIADCQNEGKNSVTMIPYPGVGAAGNSTDILAGFTSGMYLSKEAYNDPRKKDAVLKLFKYLTSREFIKMAAEANGGLPAARVEPEYTNPVYLDSLAMFNKAEHTCFPIDAQIQRPAWQEFVNGVSYIVAGKKTPEEVLEAVHKAELQAQ